MEFIKKKNVISMLAVSGLIACDALPPPTMEPDWEVENRHLEAPELVDASEIPGIVRDLPVVTAPQVEPPLDLYSVIVQEVPVREFLFAMARDANINIDVHSAVTGNVSINAIDQSLPQILERISNQVEIVWTFVRPDYLAVRPDLPVLRNYQIDYVNIMRSAESEVSVSSAVTGSVGGDGGGDAESNNSTTLLTQSSANEFWTTLGNNLATILGENSSEEEGAISRNIVVSPESGLVTVRATNRQHSEIFDFIESVRTRALYQVLIEATVVEVNLSERYQAGVDWDVLARDNGEISFGQNLLGLNLNTTPTNTLIIDDAAGPDGVTAVIQALNQFGDISVLSSPKLMALNNQTAMLRVVDNRIYFTIDVEAGFPATPTSPAIPPTFTSEVHTVPVGFTMAVTPQISENDQVTLNVRPTVSRIIRFVEDPNPALADASVVNLLPELQIREIESILKVDSGEIAVLGGLMQDTIDSSVAGLPFAGQIPIVGNIFNYRDDNTIKTELIIFIRPVVIRQASINGDLESFREYLPTSSVNSNVLQKLNPF